MPRVLTGRCRSAILHDAPTLAWAARWQMASGAAPTMAARIASASVMSTSRSRPITSSPSASRWATQPSTHETWLPVTRTRTAEDPSARSASW